MGLALLAIALAGGGAPAALRAQATVPAESALPPGASYQQARALVEQGRGREGRALVDTLLGAAEPGTPAFAEALWWRAVLAEDGASAERDLRALLTEYSASPRAVDAVLRLAQLDLARGRPGEARARLEQLLREHPEGVTRARGRYWLARAQAEGGDPRAACGSLNEAAAAALPGDLVARQVVALRRRVPGCELTVAVGSGAAVAAPAGPPAVTAGAPGQPEAAPAGQATVGAPPGAPPRAPDGTTVAGTPTPSTARPPVPTPSAASPGGASVPSGAAAYSVQLAAYNSRREADALAAQLAGRGIEARATGVAAPFRVRVGRWPTRAAALAAQRDLARRGLRGFVTAAEPPGS